MILRDPHHLDDVSKMKMPNVCDAVAHTITTKEEGALGTASNHATNICKKISHSPEVRCKTPLTKIKAIVLEKNSF